MYAGVRWEKRHIIVRDGCACRDCGEIFEKSIREGGPVYPLPGCVELDHIIRVIDGGTDHPDNLQLLCPACHRIKTRREARSRAHGHIRV